MPRLCRINKRIQQCAGPRCDRGTSSVVPPHLAQAYTAWPKSWDIGGGRSIGGFAQRRVSTGALVKAIDTGLNICVIWGASNKIRATVGRQGVSTGSAHPAPLARLLPSLVSAWFRMVFRSSDRHSTAPPPIATPICPLAVRVHKDNSPQRNDRTVRVKTGRVTKPTSRLLQSRIRQRVNDMAIGPEEMRFVAGHSIPGAKRKARYNLWLKIEGNPFG